MARCWSRATCPWNYPSTCSGMSVKECPKGRYTDYLSNATVICRPKYVFASLCGTRYYRLCSNQSGGLSLHHDPTKARLRLPKIIIEFAIPVAPGYEVKSLCTIIPRLHWVWTAKSRDWKSLLMKPISVASGSLGFKKQIPHPDIPQLGTSHIYGSATWTILTVWNILYGDFIIECIPDWLVEMISLVVDENLRTSLNAVTFPRTSVCLEIVISTL